MAQLAQLAGMTTLQELVLHRQLFQAFELIDQEGSTRGVAGVKQGFLPERRNPTEARDCS